MRELHLYKLKVDYISDSTTNVERALKMESVMSSFRLLMAENNRYVKLAFLQLNLYMVTSICALQPQSVQSNLNSCNATSIRAQQLDPKSKGLFQGAKMIFRT